MPKTFRDFQKFMDEILKLENKIFEYSGKT